MQTPRTTCLSRGQAVAQRLIAYRSVEQAIEQRAQIKPSAPAQDRQPSATRNLLDRFARHSCVFPRGEKLVGIQNVDEMVRNTAPLGRRQFRGADVEMAIY